MAEDSTFRIEWSGEGWSHIHREKFPYLLRAFEEYDRFVGAFPGVLTVFCNGCDQAVCRSSLEHRCLPRAAAPDPSRYSVQSTRENEDWTTRMVDSTLRNAHDQAAALADFYGGIHHTRVVCQDCGHPVPRDATAHTCPEQATPVMGADDTVIGHAEPRAYIIEQKHAGKWRSYGDPTENETIALVAKERAEAADKRAAEAHEAQCGQVVTPREYRIIPLYEATAPQRGPQPGIPGCPHDGDPCCVCPRTHGDGSCCEHSQ